MLRSNLITTTHPVSRKHIINMNLPKIIYVIYVWKAVLYHQRVNFCSGTQQVIDQHGKNNELINYVNSCEEEWNEDPGQRMTLLFCIFFSLLYLSSISTHDKILKRFPFNLISAVKPTPETGRVSTIICE